MKNILIIAILFLTACDTVLTGVEVPQIDKKMVFYGGYSNLQLNRTVDLTYSKPIFDQPKSGKFEYVQGASIQLVGNGDTLNHWFNANEENYRQENNFKPVPGVTYFLSVTTPDGAAITSHEIMPDSITGLTYSFDTLVSDFSNQINMNFEIDDNPNMANFYRIEVFKLGGGVDTIHLYSEKEYYTDQRAENGKLKGRFQFYPWDFHNTDEVLIVFSHINESHYQYGSRLRNYAPDNPFGEPEPLPNNVTGGLGLFSLSNSILIKP
jgi:hypothetical protein